MRRLALAGLSVSCVLLAVDGPGQQEKIQQAKTEQMDFPSGGLLRLNHSVGNLTIEGLDRPGIAITITKTTKEEYDSAARQKGIKELDQVGMGSERYGNELALNFAFPEYGHFSPPLARRIRFDLECHIYVPRSARLAIDHGEGNIYIEDVTGDIDAAVDKGTILVRLPEQGRHDIDARSKWGSITSDFSGQGRKAWWQVGHQFAGHAEDGAQKLHLRAGYGDIIILKERVPKEAGAKGR
jgi:hypothetical protein